MEIDGKDYEMLDTNFPTIDPEDPYALTGGGRGDYGAALDRPLQIARSCRSICGSC